MSSLCLFVADLVEVNDIKSLKKALCDISKKFERRIDFSIMWEEPMFFEFNVNDKLFFSISDSPDCDNCEMLFLPDGWVYNGKSNSINFKNRMSYLQCITDCVMESCQKLDIYIGQSGTEVNEFSNILVKRCFLSQILTETIGINGTESGFHFVVLH